MEAEHDIIENGTLLAYLVPAIENTESPTTSEIEAGQRTSHLLTTDGLVGFEPDTGDVDNTSAESTFGTRLPGRPNYSGAALRLKKQSEDDDVYQTLQRNVRMYLVVRRYQPASEPIEGGDEVEVYPIACGETRRLQSDASGDGLARYEVPVKIYRDPSTRAIVLDDA